MKCFICKYTGLQWVQFFTLPVSNYFEQSWRRFLDDCLIFLRLSLIKPNKLLDVLNNINPAIQFTMETNDTQLPFLDVMINKEGKKSLWIFMQNQRIQKDMSPSEQTTPSIACKMSCFLLLVEFA